jgi:hypothetical protein
MNTAVLTDRQKHYRFPAELISHGVWLYDRLCLCDCDVEELLFARGIMVTYEAIRQWCRTFGQAYANPLGLPGETEKFWALASSRALGMTPVDHPASTASLAVSSTSPQGDGAVEDGWRDASGGADVRHREPWVPIGVPGVAEPHM